MTMMAFCLHNMRISFMFHLITTASAASELTIIQLQPNAQD